MKINILTSHSQKIILSITIVLLLFNCDTGVEPSPEPGILRVLIQQDPADTTITIARDTIYSCPGDSLEIAIFQNRAFADSSWAILYQDTSEYMLQSHHYNLFERQDSTFKKFKIINSYLPPDDYTNILIGVTAEDMLLTYGYRYGGVRIPIESDPEAGLIQDIAANYTINSGRITEVLVRIMAFQSVERFRDVFYFNPKFEVVEIRDAGKFENEYKVRFSDE